MKYLLLIIALLFLGIAPAKAQSLNVECTSESGMSLYNLSFDLLNKTGLIRYRFMKQDITYRVIIDVDTPVEIWGRARFESSRTGEVRGNRFSFLYYKKHKKFVEMNSMANCR